MIELIATVESIAQAQALLPVVDTICFGEETFGLRLPHSFSRAEQKELVALAHAAGKQVLVAVNGLMHPEKMKLVPEYLAFLNEIKVDKISVGDAGVVYVLNKHPEWQLPFVYDGETLVTSSRQINFWAKKGASGAVLAREVPFAEMQAVANELTVPAEVLVYGATCIHQSKRPLLQNYYNFTQQEEDKSKERGLFLSEPKKTETHYSIFEDSHGTHIFASDDLCLVQELADLAAQSGVVGEGIEIAEGEAKIVSLPDEAVEDMATTGLVEEKAPFNWPLAAGIAGGVVVLGGVVFLIIKKSKMTATAA